MVHVSDHTSYNLSLLLTVNSKWGWIDAGAGDFASILRGNDKKLDSMTATSTRVRSGRSVAQFSWVRSVGFEKGCARYRIKANRVGKAFLYSFVCSTAVEETPIRCRPHSTEVESTPKRCKHHSTKVECNLKYCRHRSTIVENTLKRWGYDSTAVESTLKRCEHHSTAVESTPKRCKPNSTAVKWIFQMVNWFLQISDVYCWDLVISSNLIRDLLTIDQWLLTIVGSLLPVPNLFGNHDQWLLTTDLPYGNKKSRSNWPAFSLLR